MLEVCLRGAANIWDSKGKPKKVDQGPRDETHTEQEDEEELICYSQEADSVISHCASGVKPSDSTSSLSDDTLDGISAEDESENGSLDIHLPRSKSPVLMAVAEGKKCTKRSRALSVGDFPEKRKRHVAPRDSDEILSELRAISEHRSFLELHVALECDASAPVLACILDRFGDAQVGTTDELGRLPLHVAMGSTRTNGKEEVVDLIMKYIWKPKDDACFHRDFLGRLPLHHGLMNRADPKLIKALLESNPSSAVDHCEILDARFMYSPPVVMATACGCPLSTIYMLVRADPSIASLCWQQDQHD
jgi:hypothetical protein